MDCRSTKTYWPGRTFSNSVILYLFMLNVKTRLLDKFLKVGLGTSSSDTLMMMYINYNSLIWIKIFVWLIQLSLVSVYLSIVFLTEMHFYSSSSLKWKIMAREVMFKITLEYVILSFFAFWRCDVLTFWSMWFIHKLIPNVEAQVNLAHHRQT